MLENTIIIGVTPTTEIVFNEEFPSIKKIDIEPYNISYSKYFPISLKLLIDSKRICGIIKKEKKQLETIIKENNIDLIISDNRLGLWNKETESIYITHQINIEAGWMSYFVNKLHHSFMKNFSNIWIPDIEEHKNLAGNLSHNTSITNSTYIGALSRLDNKEEVTTTIDYLILISGPEPQRTLLENDLILLAKESHKKICFVRGTSKKIESIVNENIQIIDYANAKQLSELIQASHHIICRSGYSTLMDLYVMKKKSIILIPTPSQYEQEYLAKYWQLEYGATVIVQKNIKKQLSLFK